MDIDIKNALLSTSLSQYLDSSELEILITHGKIVSFASGEVILEQGKYSSGIYIIIDGAAKMIAKTLESESTNIAALSKGDFIGEINLLANEPYSTSIIANTSVECILITNVYLNFILSFFPEIKYKIILAVANQISIRIKNTHKQIISFLEKSDMATQPFLGRVITSLMKPTTISYDDAKIDKQILHTTDLFTIFNKEEYEQLLDNSELLKAAKFCSIINEEDKNSDCYIVIRGAVQSSIIHSHKVAKLSVLGPNTLFCSISSVNHTSLSTINFTTCEQSILLKLAEAKFNSSPRDHKQLRIKLFQQIFKSIVALERSVQKLDIRLNIELYNR